jgi:hypothetical protein
MNPAASGRASRGASKGLGSDRLHTTVRGTVVPAELHIGAPGPETTAPGTPAVAPALLPDLEDLGSAARSRPRTSGTASCSGSCAGR